MSPSTLMFIMATILLRSRFKDAKAGMYSKCILLISVMGLPPSFSDRVFTIFVTD